MMAVFIGTGIRNFPNDDYTYHKLDTIIVYANKDSDTLFFVIDNRGDTIDHFLSLKGKRLSKGLCDYLFSIADSLKEE